MYKIFPIRSLAYLISLLTLSVFLAIELTTSAFGIEVRLLAIPGIVWAILVALTFNPIWRTLWAWSAKIPFVPDLNDTAFPDLNGQWEMLLQSNWSRQEQLMKAAQDEGRSFDIKTCDQTDLAPLLDIALDAEIVQTWFSIKMRVANPRQDTPIKESQTYLAIPRKRSEGQPATLCYFYDQINDTDNQADDPVFSAAACLSYNRKNDHLEGTFWTARQWRRAINTAGKLTLSRRLDP